MRFSVRGDIVLGLRLENRVKRSGIPVEKQRLMIGSYAPRLEPYEYSVEDMGMYPHGFFSRGSYTAQCRLLDDDGNIYLDYKYALAVKKEWEDDQSK